MNRFGSVLLLLLAFTTCRDGIGPQVGGGLGRIAVAPVFPSGTAMAEFGLAIDRIRIFVVRPPLADTIADTTAVLPPDASFLDLDLRVPLRARQESLSVTIEARAGAIPLFSGTSMIEVSSDARLADPVEIPVTTYIGPGAGVDSIVVLPRAPFLYLNDSLRFQIQAFQGGVPVTQFYVSWSTSDSALAAINGFGVLRAPGSRSSVRVHARTPSGAADSVSVDFVPPPTQLIAIGGDGQSGAPGQPLPAPLEIEVRAADGLPVGGAAVRFRALDGGLPGDTTVLADAAGRAQVTATLGTATAAQRFEASLTGFPGITAVSFAATVPAPTSITIAPDTVSMRVGDVVVLTATVLDAAGSPTAHTVHWAKGPRGAVTFLDTSVANQATVRLDAADSGVARVVASWGSTSDSAEIANPVQTLVPGLGAETNGIVVNGVTKRVYVATDTGVAILDDADRPVGFIRLPEPIYYMGIDETRNTLYAGARFSGNLYVIQDDVFTDRSIAIGRFFMPPFAIDEPSGNILAPTVICVVNGQFCQDFDFLGVFDPATGAVVDTFFIGDQGVATAYDPVNRIVYAGVFAGPLDTIKVIDLAQRKVVDSIEVGSSLANLAFNPVTRRLYASDYVDNQVYVIDGTTNQVIDRVAVGLVPEGIAIDRALNRLYVTSIESAFVHVLDGATHGTLQVIDTQGSTSQVAVWSGARQVYVNVYGGGDVRVLKF